MWFSIAQRVFAAWNLPRAQRFAAALHDPAAAQKAVLADILRRNADSEFGRKFDFARLHSRDAFSARVPLSRYEDYEPAIRRIMAGEPRVLTTEAVTRLVPTGGSDGGRKLVPFTLTLQRQFNRAIGPWIVDLYGRHRELLGGPAYWSISPAVADDRRTVSVVPIGFDDDTAYLGGILQRVIGAAMAVPPDVRRVTNAEEFRYVTLLHLLRARELRLISVWHPSFLSLLLDALPIHWERLLADRGLPRSRALELRGLSSQAVNLIWPRLTVVSCWTDASARSPAADLQRQMPGVVIEGKGLLATEGVVSLPLGDARPAAMTSHFIELLDDGGNAHPLHLADVGGEYEIVLTTGGGFYRYRLGDRVRVDGRMGRTPTLTFLGRQGRVSDRVGEKLSDAFVAAAVGAALRRADVDPSFWLLAPEERQAGAGYTLYIQAPLFDASALSAAVEADFPSTRTTPTHGT